MVEHLVGRAIRDNNGSVLVNGPLNGTAQLPVGASSGTFRQQLYRERREEALEHFIARLRGDTRVEIVDPELAAKH